GGPHRHLRRGGDDLCGPLAGPGLDADDRFRRRSGAPRVRAGRGRSAGHAAVHRDGASGKLVAEATPSDRRGPRSRLSIREINRKTTMPRTAALKPEQVPAESQPTLGAFTKNIGFTPNMMATFAQSPIAFNAWATLLGALSKALDVKTRDSIGLAVSEVNGCNYCLTVHSFTAEHMAKLPADEIILAP